MKVLRIIGLLLFGFGIALMLSTLIWHGIFLIVVGFNLAGLSIWNVIFRRRKSHE